MIKRFNINPLQASLAEGHTILVPNQRIRDALLYAYADSSDRAALFTPDVNAVDVWIRNQWSRLASQGKLPFSGLRLLDTSEESLLWIEVVDQSQDAMALLNLEETAASAQRAYQMYRMWIDHDGESLTVPAATGIPEFALFNRWCRLFLRHCNEQGLISLVDATYTLTREIGNGAIPIPGKVSAVNFYQPPPLYRKLFNLLIKDWESGFIQTASAEARPNGQRTCYSDPEAEIRACANWAKGIAAADPDAHVAVICGDNKNQPVINRIFKDTFSPNRFTDLSADTRHVNGEIEQYSFLDQPVIAEALLILNLGNPVQDAEDFCRLLRSPILRGSDQELDARLQLEQQVREKIGTRCTLSQLLRIMSREDKPYYCPILKTGLLELSNQIRSQRSLLPPGQWVALFTRQLELLSTWPGSIESAQHPGDTFATWLKVLQSLSGYRPLNANISRATALSRLRILCQRTLVTVPFDPVKPVSVYSLSDAVGLEFSHVWFLGFNDQAQPAGPAPSPFLPHAVQRAAGIPGSHSEIQLRLAEEAFRIVCDSTPGERHASFHLADGDEEFRVSSLIADFDDRGYIETAPRYLNSLAADCAEFPVLASFDGDTTATLTASETLRGGQAVYSDQSACPFRAYANHRLLARPLETLRNGLDARTRGTALHIALEKLFSRIHGSESLQQLTATQSGQLIEQCADAAVEFLASNFPELMTPRFRSIEQQRLEQLLAKYLELEKNRHPYQVAETEKTIDWEQDPLRLRLKVDRIDRLENGSLAIIDYKTGKTISTVKRLNDERPENLQLPLYYCAASSTLSSAVEAVVIAQVNAERVRFHGLAAGDSFHPEVRSIASHRDFDQDWATLAAEWQERIRQLGEEFIQGVARVEPVNGNSTCNNCRLQPLCRVRELNPLQQYLENDQEEEVS